MIRLRANVDGAIKALDVCIDRLEDIEKPLARFGGYLRARAKKRVDAGGPGWAPLAPSTMARKPTIDLVQFLATSNKRSVANTVIGLRKKVDRALAGVATARTEKARDKALGRAIQHAASLDTIRKAFRGALKEDTIAAMLELAEGELRRRKIHGAAQRAARDIADPKARRRVANTGKRRYLAEEYATKILGGVRNSISIKVEKGRLEVYSKIAWSGVHNDGGKAGNNATIPARPFLILESADLQFFAKILQEYMIESFAG